MTEKEKRVVRAVFYDLICQGDDFLHTFIGSETIKEMKEIFYRLKYEDYCNRNGITYEQMTEDDFMRAYFEEYEI